MKNRTFYDRQKSRSSKHPNFPTIYAVESELIKPKDVILDLGCGTGRDVYYLRQLGYDARGIDSNKHGDMIALGKEIFGGELPISKGDMTCTGLPADSIDVFIYNTSLHHLKSRELEDVFDEMERLSRPGARIVGFDYSNKSADEIDFNRDTPVETVLKILDDRRYKKLYLLEGEMKPAIRPGRIYAMFFFLICPAQ